MAIAGLVGAIWAAPREAVRALGLGLRDKFTIGSKTVTRPSGVSQTVRKLFDVIGETLADPNGNESDFNDARLVYKYNRYKATKDVPLATWQWTINLFVEAGVLERGWEIRLPDTNREDDDGWRFTPQFNQFGKAFPDARIPMLTDADRDALLGQEHALNWVHDDTVGPYKTIVLKPEHFAMTYRRTEKIGRRDI